VVVVGGSDGSEGLDQAVRTFTGVRPRLFGIAYRMLGSATEAEDLVQEVWVRWQSCDRSAVVNPAAFLATTATRLAINALRSARVRRETYVGPWLPEPVDTDADPYLGAERGEALELAVLTLMEKLSPTERAAYVLREAFDYPYQRIADVLRSSEAAARQLVSRARKLVAGQPRAAAPAGAQRELLAAFLRAARSGDLAALEALFAAGVSSVADGNGAHQVARRPVVGAPRVARYIAAFSSAFWDGVEVRWATANGQTCAVLSRDGAAIGVVTVDAAADGIDRVLWMMNPAKITNYAGRASHSR
jgi:RNA polymerase sigma-70 factor (ECF subfamily)